MAAGLNQNRTARDEQQLIDGGWKCRRVQLIETAVRTDEIEGPFCEWKACDNSAGFRHETFCLDGALPESVRPESRILADVERSAAAARTQEAIDSLIDETRVHS